MAIDRDRIRTAAEAGMDDIISFLNRKIAMRAISAQGVDSQAMKDDAQFVADAMETAGVKADVVQSQNPDGTPGAWEVIGSKTVDPSAPTVLLYAHHDVQPAPDDDGVWETDPFTGTVKGGRLYGRGSSDDGAGIAIHLGALKILGEGLGVNVKLFIEGEEEMGSNSFIPFVRSHPEDFDADIMPLALGTAIPESMRRLSPATRTIKNSSRLLAKIASKFVRSSKGSVGSCASCKTRLLNFSQLISRSKNRSLGRLLYCEARAVFFSAFSISAICSAIWLRRTSLLGPVNFCGILQLYGKTCQREADISDSVTASAASGFHACCMLQPRVSSKSTAALLH